MFNVHLAPSGRTICVPPDNNVLAAALDAGIALPYSCRAGRCASCKARLIEGRIEYPQGCLPPGITAAEAASGEVLLCQAQPRTDLHIEARRVPVRASPAASGVIVSIEPLPLDALRIRLRIVSGEMPARPGSYVDVRSHAGDAERLAVIGAREGEIDLEAGADGSALREWLGLHAVPGIEVRLSGPFDKPR